MKILLTIILTSLVILLLVFFLNIATYNGSKTISNKQIKDEKKP
jgi:hypothetical protein